MRWPNCCCKCDVAAWVDASEDVPVLQLSPGTQVKTSRTFLRDCTVISPLALLLFGGPLSIAHAGGYVSVDRFRVRQHADLPMQPNARHCSSRLQVCAMK